ncbi:MAG TPA: MFS transporter [Nitrososphaerales archaeon]|nr:MFS transporter [Nitrososphaerales archaeon]
MGAESKKSRVSWVYSVFPISVSSGPLGTMVQLYLIELNGLALGTIYGGLAAAIFNGVSIPAALFWGLATDRLHRRRALIAFSYAVTAVVLVSFYFDHTTAGTIARYSAVSFVSVASATPLNLLIMETEKKDRWAGAFAKLSMVSSIGNVAGLILSTFWSQALPGQLILLFVPMGFFALASTGLAVATISEPPFVFERETVALRKPSLFSRLRAIPVFFITVPKASDFRRSFRGLRSGLTSYVPLFYISTMMFYASSGLFNTSFVPAMHLYSLTDQEVFSVILAGSVVQTLAFQGAGSYVSRRPLATSSIQGLLLRGWSYVGMGVLALLVPNSYFLVPALIVYSLAAGVAFAVYYTSSNTMVFNTVQHKSAGAALGVYSAVVGIATMGGSLASGFISVYLGFYTTFVISGVLLFAAVAIVARMPRTSAGDSGFHH